MTERADRAMAEYGIVAELQRRRALYGRYAYQAPVFLVPASPRANSLKGISDAVRGDLCGNAAETDLKKSHGPNSTRSPVRTTSDSAEPVVPTGNEGSAGERDSLPPRNLGGRPQVFAPDERYPVAAIFAAVCAAYEITVPELLGERQTQRVARPRFAAIKLLRESRNMSFPQIAKAFGRTDHTTAMSGYKRADYLLTGPDDPDFAARYRAAARALRAP